MHMQPPQPQSHDRRGVTKTQVKNFEFLNKSAFIRFIFVVIVIRYEESYNVQNRPNGLI